MPWTGAGLHPITRSAMDGRLELGIHPSNVLLDPPADGRMQAQDGFPAETFRPVALLELVGKHPELFMGLSVFFMGRAPVTGHALFLKLEMRPGIVRQEIQQLDHKLAFLPGGIGGGQQLLQMIDMVDQRPVLQVDLVGAGCELFSPGYHASDVG